MGGCRLSSDGNKKILVSGIMIIYYVQVSIYEFHFFVLIEL